MPVSGAQQAAASGSSKREREEAADVAMEDAPGNDEGAVKAARPNESSAPTQQTQPPPPAFPEPREGDCMVFVSLLLLKQLSPFTVLIGPAC